MSFSTKVFQVLDTLDVEAMKSMCHEEFIFVDDYEMLTRDDWIERIQILWTETPVDFSRERNVIADQRDIFCMQYTLDINDAPHRITNVSLLKDGKFWRSQIHRVLV